MGATFGAGGSLRHARMKRQSNNTGGGHDAGGARRRTLRSRRSEGLERIDSAEGAVAGVLPLKRGLTGEQSLHHRSGDIVTTIDAARVTARHEEERGSVGDYDVTYVLRTAGAVGIGSLFHRKAEFQEPGDGRREPRRLVFALALLCESHCCSALLSEVRHMVWRDDTSVSTGARARRAVERSVPRPLRCADT